MAFKIDFDDGSVLEWHATTGGLTVREYNDYTPTIYVAAENESALDTLSEWLAPRGDVVDCCRDHWRPAFRRDEEPVCHIDVSAVDRIRPLAGEIRRLDRPGTYRLFNVDFSPQFRYCLERGRSPVPDRKLTVLTLSDPSPGPPTAPLTRIELDGTTIDCAPAQLLCRVQDKLDRTDPDVLVLSSGELVPALFETAESCGCQFQLGRRAGYKQLASASTYESYGQVGHSPARYSVPGRVSIDQSNTFFYRETNLEGCLDLVERSHKPLQELAWASIGNVLTAIQSREALSRGVLVPWKSWRHELPKTMRQLHDGDRGGFTFAPDVGVHETVHELDFSSLYPNIICTQNISPETIRCECHDRSDVPGLDYSICADDGYLPDVLQPIIDARDDIKTAVAATDDPAEQIALEGQSDALKWILVSCFGYQGFSNAKFGRIECHESINAFAREILLDAKAHLEASGWRVVHGIVDSLWVTPRSDSDQRPLDSVAPEVTDATGIRLEHEASYDWIAFVPLRTSDAGALTKYFGRRRDGSFKYRGIECRQRSTAPYVTDCQRRLIKVFDSKRDPQAVCAELAGWVGRLTAGSVDTNRLTRTTRTSKRLEEYRQSTRTTAALERCADQGFGRAPGQDVTYVVVDDSKQHRDRVRLAHEDGDEYDETFYRERLLQAAEAVLSPLGWNSQDITAELDGYDDTTLAQFGTLGQ